MPIQVPGPGLSLPGGARRLRQLLGAHSRGEAFFKNIVAGAELYGVRDLQKLILSRITPLITDLLAKPSSRTSTSTAIAASSRRRWSSSPTGVQDTRLRAHRLSHRGHELRRRDARAHRQDRDMAAAGRLRRGRHRLRADDPARGAEGRREESEQRRRHRDGLTAGLGLGQMLGGGSTKRKR